MRTHESRVYHSNGKYRQAARYLAQDVVRQQRNSRNRYISNPMKLADVIHAELVKHKITQCDSRYDDLRERLIGELCER